MAAFAHLLVLLLLLSAPLSHALQSSAWLGQREGCRRSIATNQRRPPNVRRIIASNHHALVRPLQPRTGLSLSSNPDDQEDKLSKLGYTSQELKRSSRKAGSEDDDNASVNVNLVEDIDAVTLTAVGFGLIAINFFIFANMGDGGIGGLVASIINLSRQ